MTQTDKLPPLVALPSLESIYLEFLSNRQTLSSGTGFICETNNGPLLLSNWHNFSGRNSQNGKCLSPTLATPDTVRVYFRSASTWSRTEPMDLALVGEAEKPLWLEHPTFGSRVDIAAIRVPYVNGVEIFPVSWRNPIPIAQRAGGLVMVIGYPFGHRINENMPVWVTGHIASEPEVDVDGLPLMLIDCRTRRGNSGSPVILHYPLGTSFPNENGSMCVSSADVMRLVGIYSGRISVGSDIGRVWKRTAISDILLRFEQDHAAERVSLSNTVKNPYFSSPRAA